jgi:ribonuclease HI
LWSETFPDVNFDIHQFASQIPIDVSSFMSKFTWHIYTDSQICLSALQNPNVSSNSHIFCFIDNMINRIPIQFHLHWISSQCGHLGNELADALAKNAATAETLFLITPHQFSNKIDEKKLPKIN